MLDTLRMGGQSLFKHEPEGVVLVNRDARPFAMMYECKVRTDGYAMSADDLLRYRDYIRQQRRLIKERQHLELTHFVIVSSAFAGDIEKRLEGLDTEGVVTSLIPAAKMRLVSKIVRHLEFADIQLFDLRRLFRRGVLGDRLVQECFGLNSADLANYEHYDAGGVNEAPEAAAT